MILLPIVALSVSIDAGPMDRVLAHLTDATRNSHIEILYSHGDVRVYHSAGVHCDHCSPEQMITQALAGTPLAWAVTDNENDREPGVVILVCSSACTTKPPEPCRPELGAHAPLPPCSPKPLQFGVTEL